MVVVRLVNNEEEGKKAHVVALLRAGVLLLLLKSANRLLFKKGEQQRVAVRKSMHNHPRGWCSRRLLLLCREFLANSEEKRERKMCLEKKCPFLLWFVNKKTTDTERERERERETRETRTRFNCYCDVVIDDADTNIIHSAKENNDGGKFRAQNARKRRRERRTQNDVLFVF